MKWFRSNIRLGSRLALFALAIQFLLSFGHFHGGAHAAPAVVGAKELALHHTVGATEVAWSDAPAQASHTKMLRPVRLRTASGHVPLRHTNDDCAICTVMALANAMVDAAPPIISSPHATAFWYETVAAGFAEPNPARVAFQPRAPPIA